MTPAALIERVRKLAASGPASFEALIAACLEELTGRAFSLQRAGSQQGRDATSDRSQGPRVFVECKRYGANTELDQRELLGETAQAVRDPDLDVWVLATSRPADDSLRDALREHLGHFGVDFVAIALRDGVPSSLEVLLASAPNSVARFLASTSLPADLEDCLEGIRAMEGFQAAKNRLLQLVDREAVGLEAWKARQREGLHEDLHDPNRSRARFRQRIDLDSGFIDRPRFMTQLDEWRGGWGTPVTPLVLVGDEGNGKTWLACSWADQRAGADPSFPAVLMVNGIALGDRSLLDVIVDAATSRPSAVPEYGQATRDRFKRKVARWTTTAQPGHPPLLLLLDGMDDGPSAEVVRTLIDQSRVDLPHIPLLVTVRGQFWEESLRPDGNLDVHRVSIGPFDDDEFARALATRGINSADLAPELMHLLRKPRYLDLAARLQDRVIASGDLTVARLKYEDWKDRYERKPGTLDDATFQRLLIRLARIARTKGSGTGRTDLMDVLPAQRSDQTINDLCTSGVLDRDDEGRFTVSEERLPLAMGLLLASEVRRACKEAADPYDTATRWLEPEDGQGVTAAAAESAAVSALLDQTFPTKGASALLRAWLDRQQRAQHSRKAFIAYVRARPQAYCQLAEAIWQPSDADRHEQEAVVMAALLEARKYAHVLDAVRPYCDRWLSFVPDPDDIARHAPEEVREQERERLRRALGAVSAEGITTVSGRELIVVDQELMRLARVALAVISHVARGPHIPSMATALLVDVITRLPRRQDVIPWVLRTAPDDIEATVIAEADMLIRTGTEEGRRAAIRLLYGLGTYRAEERALSVTKDSPPQPSHRFPWTEGEYITELAKESRLAVAARGLSKVGLNPSIEIPLVGNGLEPFVQGLDPRGMWHGASQTFEEHALEDAEVVFARSDPRPLVAFYRKAAETARERSEGDLLALCWAVRPNMLLLDRPAEEALQAAWRRVLDAYDDSRRNVERTLLLLLLQGQTGQAQLDLLLKRPAEATDYLSFAELFRGEPDWDVVTRVLQSGAAREVARVAWFLSTLPRKTPSDVAALLTHRSGDPDRYVRLMVLWWARLQEDSTATATLANWTPSEDADASERKAGGLLFARCRSDPRSIPGLDHISSAVAVRERGFTAADLEWYGNEISKAVGNAGSGKPWPHSHLALAKGRDGLGRARHEGLTFVDGANSMVSSWATWGGLPTATAEGFARIFNPADRASAAEAELRNADSRLGMERAAGKRLYDDAPDVEVMLALDRLHPDQVAAWVTFGLSAREHETDSVIDSLVGLYQSLCTVGFRNGRPWSVDLCRALAHVEPRWIDGPTGISWVTFAAWEPGPIVEVIQKYREELFLDALSDLTLCELVVAAERSGHGPALLQLLDRLLSDPSRLTRARAIAALGFVSDPGAGDALDRIRSSSSDPWLYEVAKTALERRRIDNWARHWFDRFLTAPSDEDAWGGLRLFLRCVDMRFIVWRHSRVEALEHLPDRRRAFLIANEEGIHGAFKQGAAEAKKTLAGYSVLNRDAWPWMDEITGG